MAQSKKRKINDELSEYILLVLLKEGSLTLTQLQEQVALLRLGLHSDHETRRMRHEEQLGIPATCDSLIGKKWLRLTDDAKYELTEEGKAQAERISDKREIGAGITEKQFLSPTAAARNTTASYIFLAAIKLVAGFFSGSVGLIADGSDSSIDTIGAAIVWFGIRFKKEVLGTIAIIGLMFVTAIILFYDSVTSVIENLRGVFVPMSMPYAVINVELLAMVSMLVISLYQRYVGWRSRSLALISQSIDSKNSVYSSAAVIVGAVFSIFGVHWVDALVGGFIAVRISLDGLNLSQQIAKSMRGHQPDFSKYKMPLEKQMEQRRMENFRNWIMYVIYEGRENSQQEIVGSLEKAFRPSYIPEVFSEFSARPDSTFDFQKNFVDIVKPLMDEAYLLEANGVYSLTDKGKTYIKNYLSRLRYKQTEL